jgi:hypothetical protein
MLPVLHKEQVIQLLQYVSSQYLVAVYCETSAQKPEKYQSQNRTDNSFPAKDNQTSID